MYDHFKRPGIYSLTTTAMPKDIPVLAKPNPYGEQQTQNVGLEPRIWAYRFGRSIADLNHGFANPQGAC